ncbi:TonB-dependent receptor [Novosphingobium sp. ERN07]|uniref:TonB-dependent receptor n=1 Tax=Novosphingobium sp. ERN07 TaxID=2726187 RepID=UPI0014569BF9|nr:TonB-dependent receptor [Novosphingobium sp. ERN07]
MTAEAEQSAVQSAPPMTDIVVTARRTSERLQDVPVAVSIITPARIEAKGSFNPVDLVQSTPGLSVTASVSNRNNLTYTIRGQGYSFGTVFPAVITYFNEVPIARLTQGQFFDVQNIQVLRGPQGVTFGRVTDGGNVMVAAQTPKEDFGGYFGVKVGNYGLRTVNGAVNVPLVADKVLFRAAFETARRDGFTTNVANGQKLDNVAYEGYRFGLTLRPVEGLENTTIVSYQNTHDNGTSVVFAGINDAALGASVGGLAPLFPGSYGIDANGSVRAFKPGDTPFTTANYLASLNAQLSAQQARGNRAVSLVDPLYSRRKNLYVVNKTTAELTDSITLTNIFGYVREREDEASNYAASNGAAVLTCHSACGGLLFTNQEQFSEELRLSGKAFDNRLTWALGGYMDEQRPAGPSENATVNVAILQRVGVNYLTTKSRAVYGSFEYAVTDNFKVNGGLRYTRDTVLSRQATYLSPLPGGEAGLKDFLTAIGTPAPFADIIVANTFAPIPHGQCTNYGAGSIDLGPPNGVIPLNNLFGAVGCTETRGSFNSTTWQAGASYKTDGGQLFYAKVSKGYRPGGVNGTSPPGVDPAYRQETDLSAEAGVKADFNFDGVFLRTNLAAYTDRYKGIQKNVVLPGAVPVSQVQNVGNGRIKGIEAEVTLIPVKGLTFGGTFAYTDAKFDKLTPNPLKNPCDPNAANIEGFCSDNLYNSVPKTQYTLSMDYTLPLTEDIGQISFGGLLYHQSSVALTDTSKLNPQSIEKPYTTLDLTANWRNVMGQPVDLGVFVTNVTDKTYRIGANNLLQRSSLGVLGNIYAAPRMWGVSLKYRFGDDAK